MLTDGVRLLEGSVLTNPVVDRGEVFPINPDPGELFFRTDSDSLFLYNGAEWIQVGLTSSLLEGQSGSYYLNRANHTGTEQIADGGTGATSAADARTNLGLVIGVDVQAYDPDLASIGALSGTSGFLKKTSANTWALDTASYLTGNQSITLSGDISGSGTTAITTSLADVNANTGAWGTASSVPTITVNTKGLVTGVSHTSIAIAASQVTSGTFADARISSSSVTQHQLSLSIAASQVTSETFADARISQSSVTQHQGALAILETQITDGSILARNAGNETITGTWSFSNPVTGAEPSTASHFTTKQYVDNLITGLDFKQSVRAATTANITLSGTQTIDGVALSAGDRVLVKNQTTASQNGIYVVTAGAWTRASDADNSPAGEVTSGMYVFVEAGTLNADSGWVLATENPITLGTTGLTFTQFNGLGQITAGAGLTKTGNTIDVGTASTARIVVLADSIDLATTGVTAGTYVSTTVDAYGRVTAASATQAWSTLTGTPTTLTGYGITDAQPLDSDLTAVAGLSTNGLIIRTGTGTAATRSIAVSGTGLAVSNADGVAGNPTITSNATSANTASTVVARDASGNFSVGTITGSLTGTATSANNLTGGAAGSVPYQTAAGATSMLSAGTSGQLLSSTGTAIAWIDQSSATVGNATNVGVTNDTTSSTPKYLTWVDATSGNNPIKVTSTLSWTPSTGLLSGAATLVLTRAAGSARTIRYQTGSSNRWDLTANSTAESGANAGSNFIITSYDDAGATLTTPLTINRATGLTTLTSLTVTGAMTGSLTGAASLNVLKAGDTMTGPLTITPASGTTSLILNSATSTATTRVFQVQTGGSNRWVFGATSTAETGTNTGSDFNLQRYDDTGTVIDSPLTINRSTGLVSSQSDWYISKSGASLSMNTLASGQATGFNMRTNGLQRWSISKNATAETGSNAGSNFNINRFDDAGAVIDTPFSITRSTGNVTMTGSLTVSGSVTGANFVGNASSATALQTGQTISASGDATGTSGAFNGTAGVTVPLTLATVNSNVGSFGTADSVATVTVNAKGLVTAASNTSIQIAESQITDGTLLARNAGNETISGSWTFTSAVTGVDPTNATHLATKQYVDNSITGLDFKQSVRAATTGGIISLSGTQTVDGVALVAGDRVLLKNQSNATQNGIYVVAAGAWSRAADADNSPAGEVTSGMYVFVEEGTTNADTGWVLVTNNPITLGSTALSFAQFTGLGQITAGAGLTKTGSTLDVGTASTARIVVNADNIDLATVTDGGTGSFLKFTRDSYGRVSGTTAVVADDITAALTYTPINRIPTLSDWDAATDTQFALISGSTNSVNGTTVISGAYFPHASGGFGMELAGRLDNLYLRTEESGTFSSWRTVLTDFNYTTYVVPKTGGTFSGNVTISTGASSAYLSLSANAGSAKGVVLGTTGGGNRWLIASNSTAESGLNAGSDFAIFRYDDAGAALATPLTINRATGLTTLTSLTVTGTLTGTVTGSSSLNVLKAGDTMTGSLTIAPTSGVSSSLLVRGNNALAQVVIDQVTPTSGAKFFIKSNNVARWGFGSDAVTESGSNAGTNFAMERYDDAGAYVDTPLYIIRSTGVVGVNSLRVDGTAVPLNGFNRPTTNTVAVYTNSAERMRVDASGNVGIGATSASGARLTVSASSLGGQVVALNSPTLPTAADQRIMGIGFGADSETTVGVGARIEAYSTGAWTANTTSPTYLMFRTQSSTGAPAERLRIRSDGGVAIGSSGGFAQTSLAVQRNITGNTTAQGVFQGGTVQSDVTTGVMGFRNDLITAAATFTLTSYSHFEARQGTIGAGSTVTNQYGFLAQSTLIGATNNFGFYSDIAAGTNRWNFVANGTAQNYFAGNVGIGSGKTVPATALDVNGTVTATAVSTGAITGTTITATSVALSTISNQSTAALTTSATTANQVVDTFSATTYRCAKYLVQITSGTAYQMTEISVIHNGTTAFMTEYGTVMTGSSLATFDADISGGNVRLLVTPANPVTTIKAVCTEITV